MPKLTTAPTVVTEEKLNLAPKVQRKLAQHLDAIAILQYQKAELEEQIADKNAEIEAIREDSGAETFSFNDFKVSRVSGVTTYIDWEHIIGEGWMSSEQKEEATKYKPKKAYTLVTPPASMRYEKRKK